MPRFVILEHDHPSLHWDLMLETGPVLRTWRLNAPPSLQSAVAAEPLADHRLVYLDYEGAIGGDRGSVCRWDTGTYHSLADSSGETVFHLEGKRVRGECRVLRCKEGVWWLSLDATDK